MKKLRRSILGQSGRISRFVLLGTLALLLLGSPLEAHAQQNAPPWEEVAQVRKLLFEAQKALLLEDAETAWQSTQAAKITYQQSAAAVQIAAQEPEVDDFLDQQLGLAQEAVAAGDIEQLARLRGEIWTGILLGSYRLTLDAIHNNQPETAGQWLQVREYRTPTRFSRASADATLALTAFKEADSGAESTSAQVRADLLDTYQARLDAGLDAIREGLELGIGFRAAESAGAVRGYWRILEPAYIEQFGEAAGAEAREQFNQLVAAVESGDSAAIAAQVDAAENLVNGFRAAPLTAEEQTRRAGQLLRFLSLVPVEYKRGVKNGEVFLDIEVQEAVTFLDGAQAAFKDLRLPLEALDPTQTAAIAAQLDALETTLDNTNRRVEVVEPAVIEDAVSEVTAQLTAVYPEAWKASNTASDLDVIATVLDQLETAVAQGQFAQAESARLEAYAIYDIGLEPRLLAFSPETVAEIENLFWQGHVDQPGLAQAISVEASPDTIRTIRTKLDEAMLEGQRILGDGAAVPAVIISNAAVIVFREGLEAVVIIAALIAGLSKTNKSYRRPLVLGSLLAFLATAITWWLAQRVLVNFISYGEKLEAVVSLIAIGVLLLITNWFFHKSYWTDWLANLHKTKAKIIQGNASQVLGFVALGFTSIYREGFETVLFLQALVLDAGNLIVLQGVALGLLGVAIVGVLIFKLQTRLPYMKLFVITAVLIGGVLLILAGKTVHVMQAVAWLPITPIQGLDIPYWLSQWFGIYPTWQSLLAQVVAAGIVLGSYYLAEYQRKQHRHKTA
ncbi:MAG: FTR1 family protein [Anaerolineales bacterium]|nr:FTR1 family protein [Anaerolineales bacterium]